MTFSQAIDLAKKGPQITRASWRDQYVALTTGICYRSVKGDTVDVSDGTKFVLVSSRRILDNWVASADDMLAEDWKEVSK